MCSDRRCRPRAGFSLIEFTVVLALIGMLAGIVTISVRPMLTRGKQNAARAEIAAIRQALDQFYSVYGRYPSNDEGLDVLRKPTERIPEPLLTQEPKDPWSHAYQYNEPVPDPATLGGLYEQLTAPLLRDAARTYLDPTRYVKVLLFPETK